MTTFAQYLHECAHQKQFAPPTYRMGQCYFNVLTTVKPKLAEKIRGSVYDPFYDDAIIGKFLSEVCNKWDVDRS